MQLGNKIQHNTLMMGNKKEKGYYLGNKNDSQMARRVLPVPTNTTVSANSQSPIERYRRTNY